MGSNLSIIDFATLPSWVLIILLGIFIIAFYVFLRLGISGNRDIKFCFGLFEIKNSGLNPGSAENSKELSKFNGDWNVKGKDIEIPTHPFSASYIYEATFQVEIDRSQIKLTGDLIFRNSITNESVFRTKILGFGYLSDGQGSISYETFSELYKKRHTTGLGALYIKFNPSGRKADGYFMTSNESDFGVGIGTVQMNKIV